MAAARLLHGRRVVNVGVAPRVQAIDAHGTRRKIKLRIAGDTRAEGAGVQRRKRVSSGQNDTMMSDSDEWNVRLMRERSHGTAGLPDLYEIGAGTCPMCNEPCSSTPGLREREVMTPIASSRLYDRVACALALVVQRLSQQAWRTIERRSMTARFEERVRERERIARELHDTLLQGTQALILSVQAVSTCLRPDDPMRGMLTDALRRADAVMTQVRDRIQNLRAAKGVAVDLAEALANAWQDLGGECELRIVVEGSSRELEADAGDEISLIGREALTNALRHSKAKVIEAQIVFCDDKLRLCVRDDGVGLDKEVLGAGSPAGHWGLSGMRERAQRLSGTLVIWSAPGAGTEIELTVPAASAYRSHRSARSAPWSVRE